MENKGTTNSEAGSITHKHASQKHQNGGGDEIFFFDQAREFFELPIKAWQRILFFEFGANISMIGIATSALFFAIIVGAAAILQNFGGVSSIFGGVSWLDLVAMKKIDETLQGGFGRFLSFFGVVAAVFGSFGLLRVCESIFDQQWGKIYLQGITQRLPAYWLILCVVPVLLFFSIGSSAYFLSDFQWQNSEIVATIVNKIIQFVASFVAFGFLYKTLNGPSVSWRSSYFGGFWGAVGFEIVKHVLLLTITPTTMNFSSQPITSFLLLSIIVCVGFVLCSGALVFGNHVAYIDQHRFILEEMDVPHRRSEPRPTREIALAALLEMTRRFYIKGGGSDPTLGLDPVDVARIARTTPLRGKHVIKLLENVGLVKIIQDGPRETSILKVHPENLTLDEFLARLEQRVQAKSLNVPTMLPDPSNQWFWQEYERALKDRFGALSLKDLAELSMIMKKKESVA